MREQVIVNVVIVVVVITTIVILISWWISPFKIGVGVIFLSVYTVLELTIYQQ